jgi:hypothetical protein
MSESAHTVQSHSTVCLPIDGRNLPADARVAIDVGLVNPVVDGSHDSWSGLLRQSTATIEDYWIALFSCVEIDRYDLKVESEKDIQFKYYEGSLLVLD